LRIVNILNAENRVIRYGDNITEERWR